MSAANGRREAKTPSNVWKPIPPWPGVVQSDSELPVSQAAGSGQSNFSTSWFRVVPTTMNAGQGQSAGSTNTVAQKVTRTFPGRGRGRGRGRGGSWSASMGSATSQASSAGGGDRGTTSVLGKRDSELAEASVEVAGYRSPKLPRLSQQHELSSQTDILDEANSLKPQKPADDSDDTTSIMIQRNSARGVEIDLKINPNTDEGREMLLDAARRAGQQNGNVDILVSMRPVK